jgi:hypothetical protein
MAHKMAEIFLIENVFLFIGGSFSFRTVVPRPSVSALLMPVRNANSQSLPQIY